jgi:hypothetical protein
MGLLKTGSGRNLSVRDFVIQPVACRLSRPVFLIAATSAEAGKTRLAGDLIRHLSARKLRIGAIKASGTGGTMDSTCHRTNGAVLALDMVDAGLASTHGDPAEVVERVVTVFRRMEDEAVDLVVVELGGELISGGNPEILDLAELRDNAIGFAVISGDTLGAFGIRAFNEVRLRYPACLFHHFTSPFRNHTGMTRRMATVGISETWDPNSDTDLARLAEQLADTVRAGGARVVGS